MNLNTRSSSILIAVSVRLAIDKVQGYSQRQGSADDTALEHEWGSLGREKHIARTHTPVRQINSALEMVY
jgi:hypothetical protein